MSVWMAVLPPTWTSTCAICVDSTNKQVVLRTRISLKSTLYKSLNCFSNVPNHSSHISKWALTCTHHQPLSLSNEASNVCQNNKNQSQIPIAPPTTIPPPICKSISSELIHSETRSTRSQTLMSTRSFNNSKSCLTSITHYHWRRLLNSFGPTSLAIWTFRTNLPKCKISRVEFN